MTRKRRRAPLAVAAALALVGASGCREPDPPVEPAPPSRLPTRAIVLVTLDTVRADHVGAYGYPLPTSPRFDELALGATLYERAMASAPWTLPTHASLFTGLDPFEHGAVSFSLEHVEPDKRSPGLRSLANAHPLAPEWTTLAERLARAGFRTAAFVANTAYLGRGTGLDQGFQVYEAHHEPGVRVNERAFRWLRAQRDRPFFLFVNYMDAHRPYNLAAMPGSGLPTPDRTPNLLDRLIEAVMPAEAEGARPKAPPRDLLRGVIRQYDYGVAHADAALGALVDELRELDLLESTLLVVTSDHGEYLGEHALVEHSKDVYQEGLWIPLLVKGAGQTTPERVDSVVASADVPRIIANRLPGELGATLQAAFPRGPDGRPVIAENYFARSKDLLNERWGDRFQRVRRAVFDWPHKLIDSSDGRHELYDLEADPAESTNRVEAEPETAQRLRTLLDRRTRESRAAAAPDTPGLDPDAATLKALRELGYIE